MPQKYRCLISGDIITDSIITLKELNISTDNWYHYSDIEDQPEYGTGWGLFALIRDARGLCWFPVEAETESSDPDLNTCTPDEFTAALCGQLDKLSKPKTGKAAHGQKSKPVSVRLPVSLIEAIDSHIAIGGWSSRGHFIRDTIEAALSVDGTTNSHEKITDPPARRFWSVDGGE
jgi:predicted DNA binding CopG/RHH family protein